jgi:hypothetical protein
MSGRLGAAAVVAAAAALALAPAGAAQSGRGLAITVDRSEIATSLGGKFSFRSTITNDGAAPASGLVAQLDVLSLREGTYVDPEDWSSSRTRYLEPVPAGGSLTTTWQLQAVNDGEFGVFVAVLPESGAAVPPLTAPTIRLDVASRRSLNPSGMVPVALGIPVLLGVLALAVRLTRRG